MLKSYFLENCIEAGTDEAGRGCLAGPVTAAAVILPDNFSNNFLNDSKLLSEKNRFVLRPTIIEEAISYSVTHIEPLIIDEINILNASPKAMQESILKFNQKKSHAMRGSLNKNYRKNYFPLFFLACAIVAAMLFAFLPEAIT